MNSIKEKLSNNFIKNVLTVSTGTLMAQLIMLGFQPFITRIFGPENYGIYGAFSSVVAIFLPVAGLTLPIAIVLPKKDKDAIEIIKVSIRIITMLSISAVIISVTAGSYLTSMFGMQELDPYIVFIGIMMFSGGIQQVLLQWSIRKKLFKVKALVAMFHALIFNLLIVVLGFINSSATVLIISSILGNLIYVILLVYCLSRNFNSSLTTNLKVLFKPTRIKDTLREYHDFPLYRSPQMLINGLSDSLPIIFLTSFFSPTVAGFYTLGYKMLKAPTKLIGDAVGDVFYPHISDAANNGKSTSLMLKKANVTLALIGLLPFGVIVIFGPFIFSNVFGSDWYLAGVYARGLALSSYTIFLTRPTFRVLAVIKAQGFLLIFMSFSLLIKVISLLVGSVFFQDAQITIYIFSICFAITYLLLAIVTYYKCKKYDKLNQRSNYL